MAQKTSPEWSPQAPRQEAQKLDHCKKQGFGRLFQYSGGFGGSIWGSKKASKIVSKIGALGLENGGSGEAPGEPFSEPKKEARGGAH